jgi:hypothetical protein
VHNAGSVATDGVDPVKYDDGCMQYAFRKEAGDMLLVEKSKMGVALFDIYTEEFVPEGFFFRRNQHPRDNFERLSGTRDRARVPDIPTTSPVRLPAVSVG